MRKIFAAAIVLLVSAPAMCAEKFEVFPTVGVCTGSYVRYRAEPSTDSDIWGRLSEGERVIVDGQTAVDGEVWYEILPKNAQDSAFVFGKYLVPFYDGEVQQSPAGRMIVSVLQTYCPNKDNDYWGEYDGEFDYPEIKRKYNSQGWLSRVELWNPSKDFGFGDIRIGDNVSKLRDILGEPDKESDSECVYMAGSYATFTFRVRDGKITRMIYEEE